MLRIRTFGNFDGPTEPFDPIALPNAIFTLSNGKRIQFSKGNVYTSSAYTNDYAIEDIQYYSNDSRLPSAQHYLRLPWVENGSNPYSSQFTSTSNTIFPNYRLLTQDEFTELLGYSTYKENIIFNNKSTYIAFNIYINESVVNIQGLLLLPDNFVWNTSTMGQIPTYTTPTRLNSYSEDNYNAICEQGGVFLVCNGYHTTYLSNTLYYWLKDSSNNKVFVRISQWGKSFDNITNYNSCVRLVKDITTPTPLPEGALPGVFSIGDGKKIHFSKGNLTYNVLANKWGFFDNQYDMATGYDSNLISLFTWGYHPAVSTNPNNSIGLPTNGYYGGINSDANMFTYDADWGRLIGDSGTWRTLSNDEWDYVFFKRTGNRYAGATVNGITGVILIPDSGLGTFVLNDINSQGNAFSFSSNVITKENWTQMQPAGFIFLPAAGVRSGESVSSVGEIGYYWSSSFFGVVPNMGDFALCMHIGNNSITSGELAFVNFSGSVRLVSPITGEEGSLPNDEIWYTSTDGNVVTPTTTTGFGANVISNTYENGKGIIKFDGDVITVAKNAFANKTTLASIEIPNAVTIIDEMAFNSCYNLTSVNIPDSVTDIKTGAFIHCKGLTSVEIPSSVITISGYGVFYNCTSLTSVTCLATVPPTMGTTVFDNTNNCPIYVPSDSVNAYKTASNWSTYASRIQAIPN